MLGELEQIVLLAVLRVGDAAYGVPVHEEIVRLTRRDLTLGTVYKTLSRLEDEGIRPIVRGRPDASARRAPDALLCRDHRRTQVARVDARRAPSHGRRPRRRTRTHVTP